MASKRLLRGVIFDLNGTLYFKEKVLKGAVEVVASLRRQGLALRFMTNTDTKTREQLHELILSYGLELPASEIFSAAHATYRYLETNGYCFEGLLPAGLEADFAALRCQSGERPDCILVGENRAAISYKTLDVLFQYLMEGSELVVMQPGRHYFLANGPHLDTGAFGALFEYATGKPATIMAKPALSFFKAVLNDMNLVASEVVVIGDDVSTDIAGAAKLGAKSVLVKTGKYQNGDEFLSPAKPDAVIASIRDLPEILTTF